MDGGGQEREEGGGRVVNAMNLEGLGVKVAGLVGVVGWIFCAFPGPGW